MSEEGERKREKRKEKKNLLSPREDFTREETRLNLAELGTGGRPCERGRGGREED